ncbi:PE family protein [Mycobacterium asiaticum]|uniref:PE family protein n=1 Tax=Mycobacterium asiaticum TaxID=1790 RepID=UPI0009BE87DF|nr:PE family protein [Mycobacterium asiaticum]
MSNVMATPELIKAAATELATVGSTLGAAHIEAAGPTLAIQPAAADEVSAAIAQLFSREGEHYQQTAGHAAAFHDQFVQHLTAAAGTYASAETGNAALLQPVAVSAGSAAANVLGVTIPTTLEEITAPLLGILLALVLGPPVVLSLTVLVYGLPTILQLLTPVAAGAG